MKFSLFLRGLCGLKQLTAIHESCGASSLCGSLTGVFIQTDVYELDAPASGFQRFSEKALKCRFGQFLFDSLSVHFKDSDRMFVFASKPGEEFELLITMFAGPYDCFCLFIPNAREGML